MHQPVNKPKIELMKIINNIKSGIGETCVANFIPPSNGAIMGTYVALLVLQLSFTTPYVFGVKNIFVFFNIFPSLLLF